jgi:hypothetical protein
MKCLFQGQWLEIQTFPFQVAYIDKTLEHASIQTHAVHAKYLGCGKAYTGSSSATA